MIISRREAIPAIIAAALSPKVSPHTDPEVVWFNNGWVWCNGCTLNRSNYRLLDKVVGDAYGDGDVIRLPDLRGRTVAIPNGNAAPLYIAYGIKVDLGDDALPLGAIMMFTGKHVS